MTEQAENGASALDIAKLVASAAILVGGIAAFYMLVDVPLAVRWLIVLGALAAGIVVALQSARGREFWQFMQGSRVELRKVVWPTRQETMQTTMVVVVRDHRAGHLLLVARHVARCDHACPDRAGRLTVALRWYVVHAYSNFEHKVANVAQGAHQALKGLDDKFGDILVPTEEVVEMRDGQRRNSERKFFPGYVLVQMEMDEDTWHLVRETPKVLGFIGGSPEKPAPITDHEANAILRRVEEGAEKPRPKVLFEPGEVVRVTDGPFNDFNGVVE